MIQPGATPGALPPWHMWGNTIVVAATGGPGLGIGKSNAQVAKISYKRPETWSFFFGCRMVPQAAPAAGQILARLSINLIVGIGRSNFDTGPQPQPTNDTQGFAKFQYFVPLGTSPGAQIFNNKYLTSGLGPPHDDEEPTARQRIDWIPAQDIQVYAELFVGGGGAVGREIEMEVSAYFAPRSHVRPDWFVDQFVGSELGGT